MKDLASHPKFIRLAAAYLMAAVFAMGTPVSVSAAMSTDIKANGADGTVEITDGDTFSYSWSSNETTACTLTSPSGDTGVLESGSGGPIAPGHPWYPSVSTPTTLTLNCTDGVNSSSDSVTISIAPTPALSTDIKANGSDGPVTINSGDSWSYSWSSVSATACTITSPSGDTGVLESGSGGPIAPGHPWYPTTSTTLTINCTDGVNSVTDSVVINLASPAVSVDIKANGSDGPVTINSGDSWNYSWTSSNATACTLTSPSGDTGVLESGSGGPIDPAHAWYPHNSTTLTLNCTDGVNSASDSVVINLASSAPSSIPSPVVTADIKANGSDGPVTINSGDSWNYSWTSTNANACTLTSPSGDTGVLESGSGGPIAPGHPWYPSVSTPTTLTLNCTDGTSSATDSVVINLAPSSSGPGPSCPLPSFTSSTSVSGTINQAFTHTFTATTTSATTTTSFTLSGTLPTGLSFAPSTGVISGTPTATGTFTITATATNGCGSVPQTLVITINPNIPNTGGGGGGSSSGGGSSHSGGGSSRTTSGEVLGEATTFNYCPYLTSYMRIGMANDPENVTRLQVFLNIYEGNSLAITGVFDEATFQAVSAFQLKYKDDILTPWGISAPTGYVYIRTLGKINQLLCGSGIQNVYPAHHTISKEGGSKEGGSKEGMGMNTLGGVPVIGTSTVSATHHNGQNDEKDTGTWHGLAAALLAWPSGTLNTLQCLYEFLLILVVAYILGSVMEGVLYRDVLENVRKRHRAKWATILLALALAFAGALALKENCLLIPLIAAFLASLGYSILKNPKALPPTKGKSESKPEIDTILGVEATKA